MSLKWLAKKRIKEVRIFIKIRRKPSVHECKGVVQSRGIGTPCTELLGVLFAWHLYRDYQRLHGEETFGGLGFDPLGRSELGWGAKVRCGSWRVSRGNANLISYGNRHFRSNMLNILKPLMGLVS